LVFHGLYFKSALSVVAEALIVWQENQTSPERQEIMIITTFALTMSMLASPAGKPSCTMYCFCVTPGSDICVFHDQVVKNQREADDMASDCDMIEITYPAGLDDCLQKQ
jgi:hypothetical protein